jgi:Family of unknown function (DUF5628)/Domain of unknown function (DUF5593)
MAHDWLLVEILGDEPVVVAHGRQLKNLVPLSTFLRRNPHSRAIADAVAQTARTGTGVSQALPETDRVVRTEAVRMPDGRVHGVQVWSGGADEKPPERPIPGPAIWDLTSGVSTATRESLANKGLDPDTQPTQGRSFADDLSRRGLRRDETKVLAMAIRCTPGDAFCGCWEGCDAEGRPAPYGFVARAVLQPEADGSEHLVFRTMNWRCGEDCHSWAAPDDLAQRILDGLAQPGTYRALVSLQTWSLLKWLDEPCPLYDWRSTRAAMGQPDNEPVIAAMKADFAKGPASGVLQVKGTNGGWVAIHVTVNRFKLDDSTTAGLASFRLPTAAELADARLITP